MLQVKTLRDERGLSQAQLAERAGLSQGFIAQIELGHKDPSLKVLVRIATALEVSTAKLLTPPGQGVPTCQSYRPRA